jgi:hypothetical protein
LGSPKPLIETLLRHILIIFIILSAFLSLSLISCSKKDDSSSSGSSGSTSSSQTFVDANHCRLTKNTSSRNSSLTVNERESDSINERKSDSRSSKRKGSDKYVDKSALSQYQTDNYLYLDNFDLYAEYAYKTDGVLLTNNPPDIGNNFTVELRFQFNDKGYFGGAGVQIIGSASGKAPEIEFRDHGKQIRYGFGGGKRDFAAVAKPDSVNFENWHHIATTFDGTNYKLYLDGVELNNSTGFSGLTPPEPITEIGNSGWTGKIDEVRIWNDARTQGEIQTNMNKTLVGNESGLVAYYPMDVNNNLEIIDKTSNANHAKISYFVLSHHPPPKLEGKPTMSFAEILPRFFDNSSCTNGPDGTTTCPYPTIRSALDEVKSGDHVYIREGRYTEMLTTEALNVDLAGHRGFSRSSYHQAGLDIEDAFLKEEDRIIFEGYPGEEVIIDGTVALNDNSSNWVGPYSHTLDNGTSINIYKTVIDFDSISREIMTPVDNITQVFVNGRYMIPAMPMNIKNPTDPTTGNPNNPEPGTIWAGIGRSPFKYPDPDDTDSWGPESKWGHDWYMPGKLENLDYPEEWAFDEANKTLYLYASDNYTPTSNNVRVRVRDRFMNFKNAYNFELKNLHFFAGSINICCGHWTIEDSKFSFSHYFGGRHIRDYWKHLNEGRGDNVTIRNTIFEYIYDAVPISLSGKGHLLENILVRYNDWFGDSSNYMEAGGAGPVFRYLTIENSFSAGLWASFDSLLEYARFENLYEGCDCSSIQANSTNAMYSTTRYTWIINAPGLNGRRFDSSCGGNNGDIYNVVSIGQNRGFRLKGDYHDVYHVTAYDNDRQDISMPQYKYCGLDGASDGHQGNWNSNLYNSIAEGSLECTSRLCRPGGIKPWTETVEIDGETLDWRHFSNLERAGIWFGRSMSVDKNDIPNWDPPWPFPMFEMQAPWIRNKSRSDSRLQEWYGKVPWINKIQSYDFRPKKGSYLIDSGVVIPGVNNGEDVDNSLVKAKPKYKDLTNLDLNEASVFNHTDCTLFNHPNLYSGQNRKYVGDAPDIGAYEYGDSVYWIPGYRYPHPSVPIPTDGAVDVPIDYSLVWNYPYKKDYSNTEATVTVSGPGVSRTVVYKYPYNVHFQDFEPGGTYNWSVTVDGVSGGTWSFKTDDKIYPLNDRSVDTTDKTSLIPYQMRNLEVSNNKISFLRFDIPSTITDSNKINLKLVVDGDSTLNSGISIHKYGQTGWGESPNNKNIGIIDHSLGETLATLTPQANGTIVWDNGTAVSLDNGNILSIDLTDKITSYGEEYSIAIRALGTTDKVKFFSKEKQLTDVGGFDPQMSVWPSISFK